MLALNVRATFVAPFAANTALAILLMGVLLCRISLDLELRAGKLPLPILDSLDLLSAEHTSQEYSSTESS